MDDNDGYSRNRVVNLAQADSGYVVCGIHHSEPLALLGLRTYSYERDTTGQTPCDSAKVVQWWYGLNDTVVHAADTTPWFCVNRATTFDTSMQFLSGQGKYKLFVQVEDSWSTSDLIRLLCPTVPESGKDEAQHRLCLAASDESQRQTLRRCG